MTICHYTTVHKRYDTRILYKQCVSSLSVAQRVYLIVADGKGNEIVEGVNIVDLGLPQTLFQRFFITQRKLFSKLKQLNADLYQFHDPELIPVSWWFAKHRAVIYDAHENLIDQIKHKSTLKHFSFLLYPFIKWGIFKMLYRFKLILCATEEIYQALGHQKKRVIYNYPIFKPFLGESETEQEEEFKICYIGSLSKVRGIDKIIQAVSEIKGLKLVLAGVFSEENYKSYCMSLSGWNKVEHLGWINQDKATKVIKQCALGMCILKPTPAYIDAIPTKVLEYMSCSIPFIATELRFCEAIVRKHKCGLIVKNEVKAIKKGILYYKNNENERIKHGQNSLKAIHNNYRWRNEEQKLLESYKEVLNLSKPKL
tara:strand:+ start:4073 stop:5179 length:1107 start_codon:yes stop_codon:yes gene_type:complete